MRYIDSGTREDTETLGHWLNSELSLPKDVRALRWQTGFFDAGCLGFLASAITHLKSTNGTFRALVGSNDGLTLRADVDKLLALAGPPRSSLGLGVINFGSGFFHPKTIHIHRADGSATAYVGSANLTTNGTSLHIEAGIILDSRSGDDPTVLKAIAGAADKWFRNVLPGFHPVLIKKDIDDLVNIGVLSIAPPVRPQSLGASNKSRQTAKLKRLLVPPTFGAAPNQPNPATAPNPSLQSRSTWIKQLSRSDAQRKADGNQRGSITLVRAGHPIDAKTWFKSDFFKHSLWKAERTRTGETRSVAQIPFSVVFLGRNLGILNISVSYAANREASQANYTTLLHLGPLAPYFIAQNLTGKWLVLERLIDGQYNLTVSNTRP